uniref:CRISPR-associated endoribonuclease n=1 Tax=candidate division WOR-3 bacterium TaxID=2052148 RepID=A0A7C4U755_UNCW3
MRLKITIESLHRNISLPIHYNYLIQSFIYRNLSRELSKKIHDEGFKYERRNFRFFTFSRIFGDFEIIKNKIIFNRKCFLYISSPIPDILESFANNIVKRCDIKIGGNKCYIGGIEVIFFEVNKTEYLIRFLSPVTIYSTLIAPKGKKKTYYYTPFEEEFSDKIKENLLKKYIAINENLKDGLEFDIKPEKVSKMNEHIIIYKETVIKAWSGIYRINGSKELIKLGYECGLGSKNSQGFGMIEPYEKNIEKDT